jgi:hypothetical protein
MPYTIPTAAEFKTLYPTFAAVADATVDAKIAEASLSVDTSWIEADYQSAMMLLAAHNMTMDGLGTSTEGSLLGFKSLTVGPLSLTMQDSGARGSIGSTSYGQRYLKLLRRSHPPVLAL